TVLLSGLGLGALAVLGFVGLGAVSLATVPLAVASVGLLSLTGYQVARAFGLNPKNNKAGAMVAAAVGGLLGLILGSAAGAGMFTAVGIILGGAYGIRLGWALTRSQREQESIPSGASIALSVIVAAVTAVVLAGVVAFLGGLATAALSAPAAVSLWGVGAAVPLLGMALPWGSMSSFPAGASYRDPTYEEIARLKESKRLAWDKSPLVRELVTEFGQAGGDIKVDPDESARYHGRSIGAAGRNPLIVLALCVFSRWAFLRAIISREQTYFTKWYSDVPASAELLVAAYANMVVSFVEMTGSTQNRWADDLDHVHVGTRVLFVGSYYSQLREALKAIRRENAGFIFSGFYTRLRDLTARELNRDPNFQFSLYERLAGVYYRPNTPQHNQPINVPGFTRIDQATHDAASKKIYGASEGDDQGDIKKGREAAKQNTLGWLYYLFLDRGEI
ncbi:MAG: hypothetical protein HY399_06410, partial [Elusimicrobia bacterium]|nr:hypothetical protein [Elusimicrobiota bacterium]